jgi:hypothetical protein
MIQSILYQHYYHGMTNLHAEKVVEQGAHEVVMQVPASGAGAGCRGAVAVAVAVVDAIAVTVTVTVTVGAAVWTAK